MRLLCVLMYNYIGKIQLHPCNNFCHYTVIIVLDKCLFHPIYLIMISVLQKCCINEFGISPSKLLKDSKSSVNACVVSCSWYLEAT